MKLEAFGTLMKLTLLRIFRDTKGCILNETETIFFKNFPGQKKREEQKFEFE